MDAVRRNQSGLNAYLLLACTIGALLVPPRSDDHTLAILPGSVATLLVGLENGAWHADIRLPPKMISIGAILVLVSAYVSTLYPSEFRPHTLWMDNNFPALLAMRLAVVLLSFVSSRGTSGATAAPPARPAAT